MKTVCAFLLLLLALPLQADVEDGQMEIHPLAEGVWLHTSYKQLPGLGWFPSNGLVVVAGDAAWIVDTPWRVEDLQPLLEWIEQQGWTTAGAVATHFHEDRASGFAELNRQGIPTWAYSKTNQLLEQQNAALASRQLDQPTNTDSEGWPSSLMQWFYPGAGHTEDNVVIWLPARQLLVGGCLVKSANSDALGYVGDARISDWAQSIRSLQQRFPDVTMVVPGHGEPGSDALLFHTIDLAEAAAAARKQTDAE